jgi:hypothetical protein
LNGSRQLQRTEEATMGSQARQIIAMEVNEDLELMVERGSEWTTGPHSHA